MQLHQIKPIHKSKKRKRVGRGGKRGTFSGRGSKGQKVRAGRKLAPVIRELIKRYPKLRGYRSKMPVKNIAVVNVEALEQKFNPSDAVNPGSLLDKKLIRRIKGRVPRVKVLGKGELTKKLTIENCQISKQAKEKVEKAGGTVKTTPIGKAGGKR
jgi:large subunit ribosomal protein L15